MAEVSRAAASFLLRVRVPGTDDGLAATCCGALRVAFATFVVCGLLATEGLAAALPNARLLVLSPPGGRQGTEFEVGIEGEDLDEATHLVFSHPGITAAAKLTPRKFEKEPEPFATRYTVTIAQNVPLGFYEVRVAGRFGLSSPRPFEVGDLPQVAEPGDNHTPDKAFSLELDTIVDARSDGGNVDYFQFNAKAGQRVLVICSARGLDSRLSGLVEILSAGGEQLRFARSTYRREPVIDFTAPVEGVYRVKISDASYRGGNQFPYRLVLSTRPFLDYVWPPVAAQGTTGPFTLFGRNLPGGAPVPGVAASDAGLEQVVVPIAAAAQAGSLSLSPTSTRRDPHEIEVQGFDYRLPSPQGPSNPVFISLTSLPIVIEQEPANNERSHPQPLTLPCEVAGRFYADRDSDWFSFTGKKGEAYSVEVFSERLTLPTDPAVLVEYVGTDDKGKETVRTIVEQDEAAQRFSNNRPFDMLTHDPAVLFTADADGTYRIAVRDLYAGSIAQQRHVYRMVVRQSMPEFQLLATCKALVQYANLQGPNFPATPTLRRGGTWSIVVQAYRRGGFDGPIALSIEGLPAGVTCPPVSIPVGEHQASVVLTAAADAPVWRGPIKLIGTARLGPQETRREAFFSTIVWNKNSRVESIESRVSPDMMLSVIGEEAAFQLVAAEDKPWEVARAGKLDIRYKVPRLHELKGSIQLELRGLPGSAFPQLPSAVIDAAATEGTLSLTMPTKVLPGDYATFLVGQVRVAYPRNPEAAARAEARKQEFIAQVTQFTEQSKAAEATRIEAEKKVADLAASAADSGQAATIAAAAEAKTKAIEAAKAAAENLRAATEEQKVVDKRATDLANAAKPQEIDSFIASGTLIVRVVEAPITFSATPPTAIAAGAAGEIPVAIKRLFDFTQPVDIEAQLPAGVTGITLEKMQLATGAESGKIVVKADAKATPGTHAVIVRAKLNYNGQALQIDRPVEVKIEPAANTPPPAPPAKT